MHGVVHDVATSLSSRAKAPGGSLLTITCCGPLAGRRVFDLARSRLWRGGGAVSSVWAVPAVCSGGGDVLPLVSAAAVCAGLFPGLGADADGSGSIGLGFCSSFFS